MADGDEGAGARVAGEVGDERVGGFAVQRCGGLVSEQDRGAGGEGAGDGDALALAAREGGDVPVRIAEAEAGKLRRRRVAEGFA